MMSLRAASVSLARYDWWFRFCFIFILYAICSWKVKIIDLCNSGVAWVPTPLPWPQLLRPIPSRCLDDFLHSLVHLAFSCSPSLWARSRSTRPRRRQLKAGWLMPPLLLRLNFRLLTVMAFVRVLEGNTWWFGPEIENWEATNIFCQEASSNCIQGV